MKVTFSETVSTGVTTTEPASTYTVTLNVILPSYKDADGNIPSDTLVITVNGKQYKSQTVKLNGSTVKIAIPADNGTEINGNASITEISATHNFKINVSADKELTIDFSDNGGE